MRNALDPQEFHLSDGSVIRYAFDGRFVNMAVRAPEDGHVLFDSSDEHLLAEMLDTLGVGCFSDVAQTYGTVWSVVKLPLAHRQELLLTLWMPNSKPPEFGEQLGSIKVVPRAHGYMVQLSDGERIYETIGAVSAADLLSTLLEQMMLLEASVPGIYAKTDRSVPAPLTLEGRIALYQLSAGPGGLEALLEDGADRYDQLTG